MPIDFQIFATESPFNRQLRAGSDDGRTRVQYC